MSRADNKMTCPNCGAEMNHHADKVVYTMGGGVEIPDLAGMGEILEEFHSCPACGSAASRLGTVAV